MFVPRGYISIVDAIGRVVAARDPATVHQLQVAKAKSAAAVPHALLAKEAASKAVSLPISLAAPNWQRRPARLTPPPRLTDEDRAALAAYRAGTEAMAQELMTITGRYHAAWERAARALRQALGDGDLKAIVIGRRDGEPQDLPERFWRTDLAQAALRSGVVGDTTSGSVWSGSISVSADAVDAWLSPPAAKRAPAGPASEKACNQWVRAQYETAAATGKNLTRSQAFAANAARDKPFSDPLMRAAIRLVPDELKRARGRERAG